MSYIAYYSRQSLSRSLNKRRRNGTALEWVGSGKDREGREGKEKRGRVRCDTWKGETDNSRLPAAKGFLRELGRNEMRSSYLYSRCKGLTRIAYYWRQSLSRSLKKRRRNGTAPSWTFDTSYEPRHRQNSKSGPKIQRREKPSSHTQKVKGSDKSTHKLRV